ncbi:hypothetical protein [Kordia jejudonensis]|uniref:hypothetical protein n=1 Tax=Kordia jejudonensis TaxID=1348245 RepID=UPI0012E043B9|nr:hypothetical protein [Kordia jejudonensis]
MKKRTLQKIKLRKTIISKLTETTNVQMLFGGFGTSPKCAYSEWESCESACEQQ